MKITTATAICPYCRRRIVVEFLGHGRWRVPVPDREHELQGYYTVAGTLSGVGVMSCTVRKSADP